MKCVRPKANAEATSPPVPDNTAPGMVNDDRRFCCNTCMHVKLYLHY